MKEKPDERVEACRAGEGYYASDASYGCNGMFYIHGPCGEYLGIMASDGELTGWEHVSVSTKRRVPNWQEMCFVKDLFWNDEECVIQYHPPKSEYVNAHPYCLHLWRPVNEALPRPNPIMVGVDT